MNIDRGTFLVLVSTLAIGGAGGYVAAEKRAFPALDKWRGRPPDATATPEPVKTVTEADAAPPVTAAPPPPVPTAPACDDSVAGSPIGDCPPPGFPTIEGGCGSFATTRCGELKQSLKPKVALAAVACLNKLTPQERCDPARVTLCGHLALMNACPERDATADSDAGANASTNANANASANPHSAAAACQAIIAGCGVSPVAPSLTECKQLLSGMTDTGRDKTRACMKNHCFDKGLIGCEGITPAK
jgi:hypothetical protein